MRASLSRGPREFRLSTARGVTGCVRGVPSTPGLGYALPSLAIVPSDLANSEVMGSRPALAVRSAWLMQELLTTFNGTLAEVALVPNHEGSGKFECMLTTATLDEEVVYCLWSRDVEGAFPEAKELKQRVRDLVDPARNLGHSDSDENKEQKEDGTRRTAFQRLMSVIRGDRNNRGDSRTETGRENEDRGW